METTPTRTKQPTSSWRGPRAALAAAAAIVVVGVAAFAIASLIGSGEPDAGSSQPRATFDGDGCTYDGPTEFALNSEVTFIVVNASGTTNVGFAVWTVPDGTTAAEILERGIFEVVGVTDVRGAVELKGMEPSGTVRDQEYELSVTLDTPGQHAINCFSSSGLDHATIFSVVGG